MAQKLVRAVIEEVERLAQMGHNINQIAVETGLSLSTISKYVAVMRERERAVGGRG